MATALTIPHLPLTLIPGEPWSEDEFFNFCQQNQDLRIERSPKGEIMLMSPTGTGTGRLNSSINSQLWNWSESNGRGLSFDSSTGYTLPDGSMRSPDASWIAFERWNRLSLQQQNKLAPICPDFVIELRSPSDSLQPLQQKMMQWIANGAQHAWLIDLETRTAEIYRPGQEPELLEAPAELQGEGSVAGFILKLQSIWS